jgi:hypothetical protein
VAVVGDRCFVASHVLITAALASDEFLFGALRLTIESAGQAQITIPGAETHFSVGPPLNSSFVDPFENLTLIGSHIMGFAETHTIKLQAKFISGSVAPAAFKIQKAHDLFVALLKMQE